MPFIVNNWKKSQGGHAALLFRPKEVFFRHKDMEKQRKKVAAEKGATRKQQKKKKDVAR